MGQQDAISAALQLQHDAGLMVLNLQVLGQFVTSLNRISSEVMRLAFGPEIFPAEAIDAVAPGKPCSHADVSYGFVAPTGWPRGSWAAAGLFI